MCRDVDGELSSRGGLCNLRGVRELKDMSRCGARVRTETLDAFDTVTRSSYLSRIHCKAQFCFNHFPVTELEIVYIKQEIRQKTFHHTILVPENDHDIVFFPIDRPLECRNAYSMLQTCWVP